MASLPSGPKPVLGRLDDRGRLIAADPELARLQQQAGAALGEPLALPQIAAIARLARELGTVVTRRAVAATEDQDISLSVTAEPLGGDIALSLEDWIVRSPASSRLHRQGATEEAPGAARYEWASDEELRLVSLSPDLVGLLNVSIDEAVSQPLTRLFRLEEGADGAMPLMQGIAARRSFSAQPARPRGGPDIRLFLSGEVVTSPDGRFAGFRGTVERESEARESGGDAAAAADAPIRLIEDALRSPLDEIIRNAERIVERVDGPLRSDYASYGNDIAAAARHLLSVVQGMHQEMVQARNAFDLSAIAVEAVMLAEPAAQARGITIDIAKGGPLPARGDERGAIQILVNLIGNAARYSPQGARICLEFDRTRSTASVTVSDDGPGVAARDRDRIFERFERATEEEEGTGLGLAICRRLARSMGGDVTLDSAPGKGARFTLTLPAA